MVQIDQRFRDQLHPHRQGCDVTRHPVRPAYIRARGWLRGWSRVTWVGGQSLGVTVPDLDCLWMKLGCIWARAAMFTVA